MNLRLLALLFVFATSVRADSELLGAEQFPHNRGALVTYRDQVTGETFRRQLVRRDFHHHGIRLEILRERKDGRHEPEGYLLGGHIGVRIDAARIGGQDVELEPAVRLLNSYPAAGDAFDSTTGNAMVWTCVTRAVETLTLADGHAVRCVVVDQKVRDEKTGVMLADVVVWYGEKMGIVKRQGLLFGTAVD
jgi:hypothetical protein